MIIENRMTIREVGADVQVTLVELQALRPEWGYVGRVETIELFRLCISKDLKDDL